MNKSNTKAKLSLVQNPKKKKIGAPIAISEDATTKANSETLEQLATIDFWKHEIASLKSEHFDSVAQATEKLIDQVLERLKLKKSGEKDIKEFLRLVFESSEILQTTLRKTLGLK